MTLAAIHVYLFEFTEMVSPSNRALEELVAATWNSLHAQDMGNELTTVVAQNGRLFMTNNFLRPSSQEAFKVWLDVLVEAPHNPVLSVRPDIRRDFINQSPRI